MRPPSKGGPMKIAIVFDSQTGNTAQVAQAIRDQGLQPVMNDYVYV